MENLENIIKRILTALNEYLIEYLEDGSLPDDCGEKRFKEDWIYDFDYMAERYPNLFKDYKEDAPEQWELEKKTILRWANG